MDFLKVPLGAAGVIAAERDSGGTRNLIDDPEYQDDEFSMDWWFFQIKEDGE